METTRGGTSDPYVVITLGQLEHPPGKKPASGNLTCRSTVKKKTLDPEWDERLELVLPDAATGQGGCEDAEVARFYVFNIILRAGLPSPGARVCVYHEQLP